MSVSLKPVLARLGRGETLSVAEAEAAFGIIMDGQATPAQIGGLLMAMRARGETVAELTGAVTAMRARMTRIEAPEGAIDVCGTGGDGAASLNISTAVTFVLAGCGVTVAKHGNKALSSRSGAADALVALGVNIEAPIERLSAIMREVGCVFLFAPRHHPALRHAAPVRVELGTRTLFNLTGPLANPAGVKRQLVGVYDPAWARPVAETLRDLGSESAWVVHGGGLDELILSTENHVVSLHHGEIKEFTVTAADAGLSPVPLEALKGGDAAENAAALRAVLHGARNGYRDTILFNAAAALIVAEHVETLPEGVARAAAAIDTGAAADVLERLKMVSAQ
ncbi:anthranilate phosphoribosyltransferase [Acidocella aromatica]|uniref:Anthranilate phosphoribosyltransferase n=1 Tax=Acidocella aromatica TaxID=1303579 RepID=A0A840VR88_9PROT|nr:anthranilate phosphoribosyltransferase [Acidocella aromatica]MBB5372802.1 anthranilate phosphoribosyltransferase/anthranilate synthase/phosphoribosyltransferase [Acidocella aromatica]